MFVPQFLPNRGPMYWSRCTIFCLAGLVEVRVSVPSRVSRSLPSMFMTLFTRPLPAAFPSLSIFALHVSFPKPVPITFLASCCRLSPYLLCHSSVAHHEHPVIQFLSVSSELDCPFLPPRSHRCLPLLLASSCTFFPSHLGDVASLPPSCCHVCCFLTAGA